MESGKAVGNGNHLRLAPAMDRILPEWFAVQTRYRHEKSVAAQLTRKNFEVYLPLRIERHNWSDRQQAVTIPLFPGYAFVRIDRSPDARRPILQTVGLMGFVSFGGMVVSVPPKQIEDLQLLLKKKKSSPTTRSFTPDNGCAFVAAACTGWKA